MKKPFPFLFWITFVSTVLFKIKIVLAQSSPTPSSGGNSGWVVPLAIVAAMITVVFFIFNLVAGKK